MAFYGKVGGIWNDFLAGTLQCMLEVDRRAAEDDEIAATTANAEETIGEFATS